jgi:nucleotide-binding universal stress UspA family protein
MRAVAMLLNAEELAARFGASLHLLHVIETPPGGSPYGPEPAADVDVLRAEALGHLNAKRSVTTGRGLPTTVEVAMGPTADAITGVAGRWGASLIVMGTHGRTGLAHVVMGSVAERVVRTAPCAVLTTRLAPAAVGQEVEWEETIVAAVARSTVF